MAQQILNLTQHPATAQQLEAGVVEPQSKKEVQNLLTFGELPAEREVQAAAKQLAEIAVNSGCPAAMIGGAPFLMHPLHEALQMVGVVPCYAFSERVSEEQEQPDGSVRKVNVFHHKGFVGL